MTQTLFPFFSSLWRQGKGYFPLPLLESGRNPFYLPPKGEGPVRGEQMQIKRL